MRHSGESESGTGRPRPTRSWRLTGAFAVGAALGAVGGAAVGWWRYGAFELGHFSSHILGGLFILGFLCLALAALRNWLRRNPI